MIRPARVTDGPYVIEKMKNLLAICTESIGVPVFSGYEDTWMNIITDQERYPVLIAEKEGKTVGAALAVISPNMLYAGKCLTLNDLYVEDSERGTGIGKKLMNAVIDLAKEKDVKAIELIQPMEVSQMNEERTKFYDKYDFLRVGPGRVKFIGDIEFPKLK